MFKATAPLQKMLRRLPLSTKQAGKEYYKGNKVGKLGTITRYGNFAPDWSAIRTYVYPQMGTKNSEVRSPGDAVRRSGGGGKDYLEAWKLSGGHDVVQEDRGPTSLNIPVPFEERPATKS
ncbi:hypothetical protein SNOG_14453 [Parastagonospora nodorum SN15]|uniref:50S ribosomal protein YmL27 n=1 Tax=Phaeosphaeria nodorum (strain SN15 / ATCC MYA-4574 / FGSC 10173) TaxID=321614 RepID=Q0U1S1_PHANO|nr:hypothetical protein SNOG_14453 [Parastagonospora nodorum SN15]EAT78324.2 hypothetical protein SNOG_14453 [Parastagonospora nodorum SN15]